MKFLCVIGSALAVGLVWFFAVYAVLTQVIGIELSSLMSALLLLTCLVIGAMVGWKMFGAPARASR